MAGVGEKIRTVDYNSVQSKIAQVIGTGSGNFGWGQPFSSSQVNDLNRITVNEWANLRNDIQTAHRHVTGSLPSIVEKNVGDTVRYSDAGTTPQQATEPVEQYDRWADFVINNRFSVGPGQSLTETKGSQSRTFAGPLGPPGGGDVWSNRLECTITVSFTDENNMRWFFNSGGEIRITSSRTGGSSNAQNNSWSSLLDTASNGEPNNLACGEDDDPFTGPIFGGQLPSAGFSPMDGRNFHRLTSSYQVWFAVAASSPYTLNRWQLSARQSSPTQVQFLVEWIDGYVDPDTSTTDGSTYTNPFQNLPGDEVDGTITVAVTARRPCGPLIPSSLGNFSVQSPTVTYSDITGS